MSISGGKVGWESNFHFLITMSLVRNGAIYFPMFPGAIAWTPCVYQSGLSGNNKAPSR